MSPAVRRAALASHLTFSVGWIGTVVAYLMLGMTAVTTDEVQRVRAAWTAMELLGWYVIVPMAVASLLTGLVMALGTRWRLFRHYWVVISLVLTAVAAGVLVLHMPSVSASAELAQQVEGPTLEALGGDLAHPAVGLVVLLGIQLLNVYKPRGMTRHGLRKQEQEREERARAAG